MPLYDFQCAHCGDTIEEMVKSDVTNPKCETCGNLRTRLIPQHSDRIRPLKEKGHRDLPAGTKPRYHGYNVE